MGKKSNQVFRMGREPSVIARLAKHADAVNAKETAFPTVVDLIIPPFGAPKPLHPCVAITSHVRCTKRRSQRRATKVRRYYDILKVTHTEKGYNLRQTRLAFVSAVTTITYKTKITTTKQILLRRRIDWKLKVAKTWKLKVADDGVADGGDNDSGEYNGMWCAFSTKVTANKHCRCVPVIY